MKQIIMISEDKLLEGLYKIPESKWAKIWVSLNIWKIPNELEHLKPSWWDGEPDSKDKNQNMRDFISPINKEIEDTIGKKACNREWNRDRMTDKEHEIYWRNRPIR